MITKIFTRIFITLGVLFSVLLLLGAYLWVTDPWGIKPFIMKEIPTPVESSRTNNVDSTSTTDADPADKHPNLTSSQEDTLELIGVDPSVLPSETTPEQEACFIAKLGLERVEAIKAGATPQVLEIIKAKECMAI